MLGDTGGLVLEVDRTTVFLAACFFQGALQSDHERKVARWFPDDQDSSFTRIARWSSQHSGFCNRSRVEHLSDHVKVAGEFQRRK